jgi:hypothetical protein
MWGLLLLKPAARMSGIVGIVQLSAQPRSKLLPEPIRARSTILALGGFREVRGRGGIGTSLHGDEVLLAASRRKALELVDEILRNISLFHRDRHRERKGAHISVEMEELLVEVGPAQKAWMSGTGLELVKPEEKCSQRSSARDSRGDAERQRSGWCGERGDLGWRILGREGTGAW